MLILGDNIYLRPRPDRPAALGRRAALAGATVFAYHVTDPERYGVVEFDAAGPGDLDRGEAARRRARTGR